MLQLADEGRVDLDAGIDRYLPDLPAADRITPRQLLNHTSGLGEYLDQPAVVNHPQRQWTPAELIAVAEAAGRVGQPGGPHRYSNTNYIVLGELIEQLTGNPWADEVHTRITEPLGMTHTSLITNTSAPGYQMIDGSLVDVTSTSDPSVGGAAGGLQSTSRDLLAFATALADGTLAVARVAGGDADLPTGRRPLAVRHRPRLRARPRALRHGRHDRHRPHGHRQHRILVRRLRRRARHRHRRHHATPPSPGPRRSSPSKPSPPSARPDEPIGQTGALKAPTGEQQ